MCLGLFAPFHDEEIFLIIFSIQLKQIKKVRRLNFNTFKIY